MSGAETFDRSNLLRVFLCHSAEDKPIVRGLYSRLQTEGWIDPWFDEAKLIPGQEWEAEIEKAVEQSHIILVCLSKKSISKEGYIQKEIRRAIDKADEKPEGMIFIVPLRLEECEIPRKFAKWQWLDATATDFYEKLIDSFRFRATHLGILTSDLSSQKYLTLERSLEQEKDIKLLRDALYEADALFREGNLPQKLTFLFEQAQDRYESYCLSNDEVSFKAQCAKLMENKKHLDHFIYRKEHGTLALYDGIPIDELIRTEESAFIECSANIMTEIQDRITKILPEHPIAATGILKEALELPLYRAYSLILRKKLNELEIQSKHD